MVRSHEVSRFSNRMQSQMTVQYMVLVLVTVRNGQALVFGVSKLIDVWLGSGCVSHFVTEQYISRHHFCYFICHPPRIQERHGFGTQVADSAAGGYFVQVNQNSSGAGFQSTKLWHKYIHTYIHTYIPYLTLPYLTLPYLTLRYITLHYITLHYITLHYITYIHTYIHTPMCSWRC